MSEAPGPEEGWVLGVDYGTKRIGLAVGDPRTGLVLPLPVMAHPGSEEAVVAGLCDLVRERALSRVIIGDPVFKSGEPSPMSRVVRRLAAQLAELLPVPIETSDERYTSAAAEAELRDRGVRWWQVDKGHVDAMSAMSLVREALLRDDPSLALSAEEPDASPEAPDARSRARDARRARRQQARKRKGD